METLRVFISLNGLGLSCSEPTVWDGDVKEEPKLLHQMYRSKPTVWDGDIFAFIVVLPALLCSKPTAWDSVGLLSPC